MGVIQSRHASVGCGNPKPAGMIKIERSDKALGESVIFREMSEASIAIASNSTMIKPDPEIARSVFTKGGRYIQTTAVRSRVTMKSPRGPLPSAERLRAWSIKCAGPNVATRVFKNAEQGITTQSVVCSVDGFRPSVRES